MNKFVLSLIISTLFISLEGTTYSQNMEDVVYLKNGSIIHGTIIEQIPNESIKIKTKDGNVFVYKMEDIEKMTKEEIKREKGVTTPKLRLKENAYTGSGFGIRGIVGTDISLGLAFGLGASYARIPRYGSTCLELGVDFLYSGLTEEERIQGWNYVEDDVEETTLLIFSLRLNGLFNYNPGKPGIYFIAGSGVVVASYDFEETETYNYVEGYVQIFRNTDDGVVFGNVLNLGIGASFGGGLESRLETPLLIFYSEYGNAAAFAPTFTLSLLYRFP